MRYYEIRDRGTLIPTVAFKLKPPLGMEGCSQHGATIEERHANMARGLLNSDHARWLLKRAGYTGEGTPYIFLLRLDGAQGTEGIEIHWDPAEWGDRTMASAHQWLVEHWEDSASGLMTGGVLDVEFILGERSTAKRSEIYNEIE